MDPLIRGQNNKFEIEKEGMICAQSFFLGCWCGPVLVGRRVGADRWGAWELGLRHRASCSSSLDQLGVAICNAKVLVKDNEKRV